MGKNQHRPVTQADYDRVAELHAQGMGRNEIAGAMTRSPRTVSEIAEKLKLSFERGPEVAAATAARKADLALRRAELAYKLIVDAEKLREQMWEETTVYSFGGKENSYNEHTFAEAPAAEKRALMGTAGMCIDRSLKLEPAGAAGGTEDAKSMLGKLAAGISALVLEDGEQAVDEGD
ncbi:hypothetical protein [Streptomyces sp. NPDC047097]|uniref:hypothetical protein n=1 Tax=Streptomyces sp. NPDC047097 TaxID=3155260 RepID=UPI0033E5C0E3